MSTPKDNSEANAPSVAGRAIAGGAWLTLARFGAHSFRIGRLLLLAHLLGDEGPSTLGVFGVALLAVSTAESLSQTGLSQALIQRQGDINGFLPSAWSAQVLRGLLLGAVMYVGAPAIASFFEKPDAEPALRWLALAPCLRGLNSIGVLFFAKSLKFKKTFALEIGISGTDFVVTAVCVAIAPTVWGLVIGHLSGLAVGVLISFALSEHKSRMGFEWARLRELAGFSSWVFVTALIGFLLTSGGDAVIGKMLPAAALGFYQMASRLSTFPTMEIARVLAAATFPAFSMLQHDPERLGRAFLKSFLVSATMSVGIAGAIIALADDVVALLLPAEWAHVAQVMQTLAVWGACRGLGATQSVVFQAAGHPRLAALFSGFMLVVFAVFVVPVVREHGLLGVSLLLAGIGVVAQVLRYPVAARVLKIPLLGILARVAAPLLAGALAAVAALQVLTFVDALPVARLVVGALVYGGTFIAALGGTGHVMRVDALAPLSEVLRTLLAKLRRQPAQNAQ